MSRELHVVKSPSAAFPPRDMWKHDPEKDPRIETRLDKLGLVDPQKLIIDIKASVDPSYQWESPFNDIHHLQWWSGRYPALPDADVNPNEFRNLAVSKLIVPRVFHNWLHRITEPPPVPDEEVMRCRIEAQEAAFALFKSIRGSKMLLRNKQIGKHALQQQLIRHFDEFTTGLERAQSIPSEFQLIDNIRDFQPRNTYDLFQIAPQIGKVVNVPVATRLVKKTAA
jgi:hypothetical protein